MKLENLDDRTLERAAEEAQELLNEREQRRAREADVAAQREAERRAWEVLEALGPETLQKLSQQDPTGDGYDYDKDLWMSIDLADVYAAGYSQFDVIDMAGQVLDDRRRAASRRDQRARQPRQRQPLAGLDDWQVVVVAAVVVFGLLWLLGDI